MGLFTLCLQINEEASEKVLEVEQKYNEIRKPVYDKRSDVIKSIPDFWLTAVSVSLPLAFLIEMCTYTHTPHTPTIEKKKEK